MLSERQLARGYPMLWQRWMPWLGAEFIRQVASDEGRLRHHARQWAPPLPEETFQARGDLISEVAFGLFAAAVHRGLGLRSVSAAEERRITREARQRMEILRHRGLPPTADPQDCLEPPALDNASAHRARVLATRLHEHLNAAGLPLQVQPRVPGTGLLQACHPDVLRGQELIEVKMSQASFRSTDFRQAVVYAALLHAEGARTLHSMSLVNPRLGVTWYFTLEDLAREPAGCSAAMLLDRIAEWAGASADKQGDDT